MSVCDLRGLDICDPTGLYICHFTDLYLCQLTRSICLISTLLLSPIYSMNVIRQIYIFERGCDIADRAPSNQYL